MQRSALSSWMFHFSNTCPDPGLKAYQELDESEAVSPRIVMWIGLLVAAEQVIHAITLAFSARKPLRFTLTNTRPFELPIGLALTWVVFTALSIVLVALTFRSNAAILVKTLHVVAESGFLIIISVAYGFYVFASTVTCVVLVVLSLVFTLDCDESVLFASFSGLTLDAVNFFVYAGFGFSRADDKILWLLIGGLGWHGMYLLTQLEVMRWEFLDGLVKLWFRIFGMYFNLIASEFFLSASRRSLMDTRFGTLDLKEWAAGRDDDDSTPYCVWTRDGLRLIGPVPEYVDCRVFAFNPHRTAYTPSTLHYAFNALFPLGSTVTYRREGNITSVWYAVGCEFVWIRSSHDIVRVNSVPVKTAYVVSWIQIRFVYWCVCLLLGYAIGSSP